MARFGTNDSSDDDFSDNLQLAERLRINRDKAYNFRKKNFLDDQSSSSSSLEMQSDNQKDSSARTYSAYNKKRQNGDKSVEFFANPKRTCLSTRYLKSPDNQSKKKSRTFYNSNFPCSSSDKNSKHIYADKTYEDHLHNLADENPVISSKQVSKKIFLNCLNETPKEDLSCVKSKTSEYSKHNDQSKQIKKFSTSNPSKHFLWREPQNNVGEQSKTAVNGARPAGFVASQCPEIARDSPSVSDGSIVHYVDSASDEDSRSMIKSGSLKGGRQSPEILQSSRKVLGRKVKLKVLDSDLDTDDDEEDWPTDRKSRPCLIFSSSESEAESDIKNATKPSTASESSDSYLFPVSGVSRKGFENGVNRNRQSYSRDNSTAGPSSSPISYVKSPRSFRNRKPIRTNSTSEVTSNNFHSNNVGRRGRSRVNVGERYTRRSGSPHPRTLPNSHSRMTRSDAAKAAKGRSLTGSQARRGNLNLATTYPDLFDAEDSSEVEFFTANSYSDTETSAESFGGLTISSTIRSPDTNGIICEHSINIGSSEDEISVVFSSPPSNGEMERQVIRSAEPRRTLGRRRQRGSWRVRHDPVQEVSLSPDPVEQVRQVEDDERFARILQAQFDAEVDSDYLPSSRLRSPPPPVVYSPYDIINSPNTPLRHSDSDLHEEEDSGWMIQRIQEPFPTAPFNQDRSGHRLNRVPHRHPPPNFFGHIFYNNRRLNRTQRSLRPAISRLLEVGFSSLDDILYSDDSFETFLGIADLNGDVPRGLQKSEINRLPTRQYIIANNNAGSSNELPHKRAGLNKECQVCLTDYENGDTLRILPCFHEFHTPCIDPWLKINHTCPVCRVVVDLDG